MDVDVPLVFANGVPACLDKLNEQQLRRFLTYLWDYCHTPAGSRTFPSQHISPDERTSLLKKAVRNIYKRLASTYLLDFSAGLAESKETTLLFDVDHQQQCVFIWNKLYNKIIAKIPQSNLTYDACAESVEANAVFEEWQYESQAEKNFHGKCNEIVSNEKSNYEKSVPEDNIIVITEDINYIEAEKNFHGKCNEIGSNEKLNYEKSVPEDNIIVIIEDIDYTEAEKNFHGKCNEIGSNEKLNYEKSVPEDNIIVIIEDIDYTEAEKNFHGKCNEIESNEQSNNEKSVSEDNIIVIEDDIDYIESEKNFHGNCNEIESNEKSNYEKSVPEDNIIVIDDDIDYIELSDDESAQPLDAADKNETLPCAQESSEVILIDEDECQEISNINQVGDEQQTASNNIEVDDESQEPSEDLIKLSDSNEESNLKLQRKKIMEIIGATPSSIVLTQTTSASLSSFIPTPSTSSASNFTPTPSTSASSIVPTPSTSASSIVPTPSTSASSIVPTPSTSASTSGINRYLRKRRRREVQTSQQMESSDKSDQAMFLNCLGLYGVNDLPDDPIIHQEIKKIDISIDFLDRIPYHMVPQLVALGLVDNSVVDPGPPGQNSLDVGDVLLVEKNRRPTRAKIRRRKSDLRNARMYKFPKRTRQTVNPVPLPPERIKEENKPKPLPNKNNVPEKVDCTTHKRKRGENVSQCTSQQTPPTKQQTPPTRQQTPPTGQQTPPTRQQTPCTRQQTSRTRQQTPPTRQHTPRTRQLTLRTRQQTLRTRQQIPPTRQQTRRRPVRGRRNRQVSRELRVELLRVAPVVINYFRKLSGLPIVKRKRRQRRS